MNGAIARTMLDEAADEDGRAAVAVEERLDLVQALLGDLDPAAVADEELAAQAPAEEERGRVAGHRRRPGDGDDGEDRDAALTRDDAAEQQRGLARHDEADEGAGLEEREDADEHVGPRPEGGADVLDRLLEVGEVDRAAAVDRGGGDDDEGDRARGCCRLRQRTIAASATTAATTIQNGFT